MSGLHPRRGCCLAVLAGFLLAEPAAAEELYFMIVFGADGASLRPRDAHTFATFVKATGEGRSLATGELEVVTISWLPRSGIVHAARLFPEPGRNFGLRESLDLAYRQGGQVCRWGPYQIRPELYYRALAQCARLESGQVRYKAAVTGYHTARVANCIRAVSDLADGSARRLGSPTWGQSASYFTMLNLLPFVINPGERHDWLVSRLGLDDDPITTQGLDDNPDRGPVRRSIQNLFHRQARQNLR